MLLFVILIELTFISLIWHPVEPVICDCTSTWGEDALPDWVREVVEQTASSAMGQTNVTFSQSACENSATTCSTSSFNPTINNGVAQCVTISCFWRGQEVSLSDCAYSQLNLANGCRAVFIEEGFGTVCLTSSGLSTTGTSLAITTSPLSVTPTVTTTTKAATKLSTTPATVTTLPSTKQTITTATRPVTTATITTQIVSGTESTVTAITTTIRKTSSTIIIPTETTMRTTTLTTFVRPSASTTLINYTTTSDKANTTIAQNSVIFSTYTPMTTPMTKGGGISGTTIALIVVVICLSLTLCAVFARYLFKKGHWRRWSNRASVLPENVNIYYNAFPDERVSGSISENEDLRKNYDVPGPNSFSQAQNYHSDMVTTPTEKSAIGHAHLLGNDSEPEYENVD